MKTKNAYTEKDGEIIVSTTKKHISFSLKDMSRAVVLQLNGDFQETVDLTKYKIIVKVQSGKLYDYIINEKKQK